MAIESVGGSLVSKIAELLAGPIIKQFRYMFCFNNFVQEFNEQVMSLALALYRLQDVVDVAKRNAEEIEIDVNKWLEDAKNEMEGVNRLEKEKGKNGKCFTWCPKWIRLFKLSKALEKKTETLRKLEENSRDFRTKVSHKTPLQDIKFLPSKEFTPSESSKEAFEQIMKALKDDNVNMIGLYGMGGLFDEVLSVTVSQNPNVMYIQDRMAESLGLQIDEKTIEGRANRLWQRLKTIKKILVILDDVWKVVDLKEIGIPFSDDHRGCKVLLTTRLRDICSYMECQQKVFLSILSENEAWALFKINAGLRDEDSTFNTVAKTVARECQGLPIALVTVGRALRDKSTVEWEDLTRYAVGYGLHQDVESIEDARKQVYVEIKTLKDCCMLLGTETEEHVKMHDLVRDVAIQIASSKEHGFMVKAGIGLKEWPISNKSFEGCTTISLMGNKLAELPEGLVCPQLKVLLLELRHDLNVPERFFEGMKEIEVLSLKGGCLSLQSLELSTNLLSLLLIECKCYHHISLRKLQRLKILGFIGLYYVGNLPDEIGELKELRLLDVSGCYIGRIPVNLIGRLKKLEELMIEGWGIIGYDSTRGMNASLTELNSLSHLDVLSLKIPRVEFIPKDFVFPRLLKYDIVLGNEYSRTQYPTSTRLYLGDINITSLNEKTFKQLFPTVSQIVFSNVEGLDKIALSCDQMTIHGHGSQKDFLQRLEDVQVNGCRDTRTLLELKRLPELKCIWKGPIRHVSLQSLVHLELLSLDKLTFIFTPSLAQCLDHLETLQIEYCSGLKHLISEKDDEMEIIPDSPGFPKLKTLYIIGCDKLEYVFPVSVSPSLLNLEEMKIVFGDNSKQIFYSGEGDALTRDGIINFPQLRKLSFRGDFFGPKNFTAQLPSLQVLTINGHDELGDLLAQLQDRRTGHELSLLRLKNLHLSSLPDMRCIWKGLVLSHLTTLKVHYCQKLTHVFTGNMIASLVQLQFLGISTCEELEQIIAKDNDEEKDQILSKSDLQSLCFPNLCTVHIMGCNKLRSLFPTDMVAGLPRLHKVEVRDSSQLLGVFWHDDHVSPVNVEKQMVLPSLSILCLYNLPSIVCFSLGCDDFLFPRLGKPMVDKCPKLTTQFANKTNGSMSAQSEVSQSS
ncbi:disease resistance protein [Salix suchowensis]|nr:disease resistance protein [Salix suchowensis]